MDWSHGWFSYAFYGAPLDREYCLLGKVKGFKSSKTSLRFVASGSLFAPLNDSVAIR